MIESAGHITNSKLKNTKVHALLVTAETITKNCKNSHKHDLRSVLSCKSEGPCSEGGRSHTAR